jgi:hypothetical protein
MSIVLQYNKRIQQFYLSVSLGWGRIPTLCRWYSYTKAKRTLLMGKLLIGPNWLSEHVNWYLFGIFGARGFPVFTECSIGLGSGIWILDQGSGH